LIILPGMDGTGSLYKSQLAGLRPYFDLYCLCIDPEDRTPWPDLAATVAAQIEPIRAGRPVYLCGESFGACLGLQMVVQEPHLCDRLILINAATAFRSPLGTSWAMELLRHFPAALYDVATLGLLPFLITEHRVPDYNRHDLVAAMQAATPGGAAWRVTLLSEFDLSAPQLQSIPTPTLAIGAEGDRLLPSAQEAQRLAALIPHAQAHILPASGHTCLLEPTVQLVDILATCQFLPDQTPVMAAKRAIASMPIA
jgi:pimeloyl-ACP methyl ester carboxylesterase